MVIWLNSSRLRVVADDRDVGGSEVRFGVHGDIVRRETFDHLLSITDAYARLDVDRARILEQANAEAAAIVSSGEEQAALMLDAARDAYEMAAERGYREGSNRALTEWIERLADATDAQSRLQVRMRERLADIIASAVENIVHSMDREALFERALSTVDKIIDNSTYLRVAVNPQDYELARAAFDRLAAKWRDLGRPIPVSIVVDRHLEPGACVCETDFGSVDASLKTQLRAMRSAVSRALKRSIYLDQAGTNGKMHDGGAGVMGDDEEESGDAAAAEVSR
ncbi:type III secretion system stator protein SctL [Burkholderia metallica]|uniref:type III secretion system stator protein SctL n=1 Tax=Burkholderia metallica TaxID=488729 RepID=UPI001CF2DF59|nr:type III secretion system stator protein SctL [Burkholderia metallica]MCA8023423.1 type III secretion system stator protein SctL [Burkholderia metallica]